MRSNRKSSIRRDSERGALTVEAAIGSVVFMIFCGFIFDFGMLVHRHSLLVDTTIKTVQQLSRDPQAGDNTVTLRHRTQELFDKNATRLSASARSGMRLSDAHVSNCEYQEVIVSAEWEAPCGMCILGKFHTTLKAQGIGRLEVPNSALDCSEAA